MVGKRIPRMTMVSVIIPAYNQAEFLGVAIESVLAQTHRNLEVIVVDDGSTDHTPEVVRKYADSRVRYEWQRNSGLSAARNKGIQQSLGGVLSYLDADDEFLPRKLEWLLDVMENRAEVGLAAGQAIPVDVDGAQIGRVFDAGIPPDPRDLLLKNPLHVGSVLIRRSWQLRVGPFDESLRSYEDWDMWLRLARAGCQMCWVDKPVSLYRFHNAQMTRDGIQMTDANFSVLQKVFANLDSEDSWNEFYADAYAHAHLRAAANAYLGMDFERAKENLALAVEYSSEMVGPEGLGLAERFFAWAESPKVKAPINFLENVYSNVPDSLSFMEKHARSSLARLSVNIAFEAFVQGDHGIARSAAIYSIQRQPALLLNRGVLSLLWRTRPQPGERNKARLQAFKSLDSDS